ncbi:MAG: beta-ribofuranosylaminobenzene 5'-phosphate synthase [ANME-2 cluster archaeon]|nr:beta-ribofuranosylaminobenzene 5'-phosphate synthase [ANME-2 cluster archaeon]
MILVNTPSRLHFTLIDLNGELGRVDGGVGLTLDDPSMRLTATETNDGVFVTGRGDLMRIETAIKLLIPEGEGIHIQVEQPYPAHVGLGSGTQSALAAGWCVNLMFGLGLSVREVAAKVGRGGTSGIGVEAFEHGGFIVDGGHRFADKGAFSPSAASKVPPGPVLFRYDFPDWPLVVAVPDLEGASSQREIDIFNQYCPIPLNEVQAVSHIILMNMLPSIIEADIQGFGDAINRIQKVGFKEREVGLQIDEVRRCMDIMKEQGAYGAGMSSFGPAVYAVAEKPGEVKKAVAEFLDSTIGGQVFVTEARNRGAEIVVK